MHQIPKEELKKTYNNLHVEDLSLFPNYHFSRNTYDKLFLKFKKSDEVIKILFGGHRGSGKSTELLYIRQKFATEPGFQVVFISVLEETNNDYNFHDLFITDVLLLILVKILEHIEKRNYNLRYDLRIQQGSILRSLDDGKYGSISDLLKDKLSSPLTEKNFFRERALAIRHSIINFVNNVVCDFQDAFKIKIILIVDDLEKVTTFNKIKEFFLNHEDVFTALSLNSFFAIPPLLDRTEDFSRILQGFKGNLYSAPLFQIKDENDHINEKEIEKLIEIARRRITDKNIFDDCSLKMAALCSGGLVDDFLTICADSILEAELANNAFPIKKEITKIAFKEFRQSALVTYSLYANLCNEIHRLKKYPKHDIEGNFTRDDFRMLLFTSLVLEYKNTNDEPWYDIHPRLLSEAELENLTNFVCTHDNVKNG